MTTTEDRVTTAWKQIQSRVETTRDLDFAHEHTLQFHFAWEMARLHGFDETFAVRFEILCGRYQGEQLRLDLLMWNDPNHKVAVEMKAPPTF